MPSKIELLIWNEPKNHGIDFLSDEEKNYFSFYLNYGKKEGKYKFRPIYCQLRQYSRDVLNGWFSELEIPKVKEEMGKLLEKIK